MEDWYSITKKEIRENGGKLVLEKYDDILFRLLSNVYPNHDWIIWKFDRIPIQVWRSKKDFSSAIHYIEKELRLTALDDWYRVSTHEIDRLVPLKLFEDHPIEKALQETYPHHLWDHDRLKTKSNNMRSAQRNLRTLIENIYPTYEVKENFLLFKDGQRLELDVYLPEQRLAFEYQGIHHFQEVFSSGSNWKQKERDDSKKSLCQSMNINLIEIPYWWDGTEPSLIATINQYK
eukprot:TRINITY_DN15820_c0_g1_i1.p1 TRINITY_DN15820_c0_g1~~TRINITY_DN15820_c0_g1_i1.p1  ORF type:complete len:269 (+),score=66.23 TRINITY_DN15820_c0_g1_i1:109-807(+)